MDVYRKAAAIQHCRDKQMGLKKIQQEKKKTGPDLKFYKYCFPAMAELLMNLKTV